MDAQTQPNAEQLIAMGYVIEEWIEERWQGPVLNEINYFRVIAPDGQVFIEDAPSIEDAYDCARWHANHSTQERQP